MKSNSNEALSLNAKRSDLTNEDFLKIYRKFRTRIFDEFKDSIPEDVKNSMLHEVGHAVKAYMYGCPLVIYGKGPLINKDTKDIVEHGERTVQILHHPLDLTELKIRKNDKFLVEWRRANIILAGPAVELLASGTYSQDGEKDIIKARNIICGSENPIDDKRLRTRLFQINKSIRLWWFKIASVCQDLAKEYLESPINFRVYIPGILSEPIPEIDRWIKKQDGKCSWPAWVTSLSAQ